jgi:hypothetical protein
MSAVVNVDVIADCAVVIALLLRCYLLPPSGCDVAVVGKRRRDVRVDDAHTLMQRNYAVKCTNTNCARTCPPNSRIS